MEKLWNFFSGDLYEPCEGNKRKSADRLAIETRHVKISFIDASSVKYLESTLSACIKGDIENVL